MPDSDGAATQPAEAAPPFAQSGRALGNLGITGSAQTRATSRRSTSAAPGSPSTATTVGSSTGFLPSSPSASTTPSHGRRCAGTCPWTCSRPPGSTSRLPAGASTLYNESSGLREVLEAACADVGCRMSDLTVLSVQRDPFRADTPAGHRDGQWVGERARRSLGGRRPLTMRRVISLSEITRRRQRRSALQDLPEGQASRGETV
jgi:hypothetical protein